MLKQLRISALAALGIVAIGLLAAQAQVPGVNSTLNAVFNLVYDNSTMKPSYTATAKVNVASSATDVCAIQGSATKNIRLRRIQLSTVSTTAIAEPVAILKRSTAAAGAGVSVTPVPYDSINTLTLAANTGTAGIEAWTANPTVGTQVGGIADPTLLWTNATTAQPVTLLEWGYLASPLVLRGVLESITVNLNGLTIAGGNITCTFEWTEE